MNVTGFPADDNIGMTSYNNTNSRNTNGNNKENFFIS